MLTCPVGINVAFMTRHAPVALVPLERHQFPVTVCRA
jgi:hypothetical protein